MINYMEGLELIMESQEENYLNGMEQMLG